MKNSDFLNVFWFVKTCCYSYFNSIHDCLGITFSCARSFCSVGSVPKMKFFWFRELKQAECRSCSRGIFATCFCYEFITMTKILDKF